MVAAKKTTSSFERAVRPATSMQYLQLIQGSFSSRKLSRQFPLVAGLHKAVDGALVGALLVLIFMSAVSFHWQHLWTIAFSRLDTTRDLTHRLIDSTAMLERNLLQNTRLPLSMVRTKAANLLYLQSPYDKSRLTHNTSKKFLSMNRVDYLNVRHGY